MYHRQPYQGSKPAFWEDNWKDANYWHALKFCSIDPLRPFFEKYSSPGSWMLEGGCGLGQYLTYYSSKGRVVFGLDFAQLTLRNLHQRKRDLPICAGDVSKLPFSNQSFDLYYSGGVVEHFEGGAEEALMEAYRVLEKNGILLISVPYYSPLRRLIIFFGKSDWIITEKTEINHEQSERLGQFYQYAYKPLEFIDMLGKTGFDLIEKKGCFIIWGLIELPFFRKLIAELGRRNLNSNSFFPNVDRLSNGVNDYPVSFIKKFLISEDITIPFLGFGIRVLRWFSANMMTYVCRKKI